MPSTRSLATLFTLDRVEEHTWSGPTGGLRLPRLFGGQLVAQSLVAAASDVPDGRAVHSVHTTFLRAGRSGEAATFRVHALRDGRLTSTREVSAWQGDRLLCRSIVSCAVDLDGLSHGRPRPDQPGPHDSVPLAEAAAADGGLGELWEDFSTIDVRLAPARASGSPHSAAPAQGVWMRTVEALPDDPTVHQAALAYASDLMLMSTALAPHGYITGHERSLARDWNAVSLDHTLWFRGPVRADEWLLLEHTTPMAGSARALIEAAVFTEDGTVVCQVAQEALIRRNAV